MLYSLFTAPSSTDVLTGVGNYSAPFATDLLPLVYLLIGFVIGGLVISALAGAVVRGVKKLTGGGRGGKRGRRR